MENYYYNNIIDKISFVFENRIKVNEAIYSFDYGDEFEISICEFLRKFLPLKYGICRGFVIDKYGNKEGDDIIIYDQENYPTLRILGQNDNYSLKEQIPVEAVYAYIEAKNSLDEKTMRKAISQVARVKKLCYSREPVYYKECFRGQEYFDSCYSEKINWLPIITNPVYGMILSAKCNLGKSNEEIVESISRIINSMKEDISIKGYYNFDSMAAGNSNIVVSAHDLKSNIDSDDDPLLITKFYTGIKGKALYQVNTHESRGYGLAFAHLMTALNLIKLGNMPWEMVFNTAKMPDKERRDKTMNLIKDRLDDIAK